MRVLQIRLLRDVVDKIEELVEGDEDLKKLKRKSVSAYTKMLMTIARDRQWIEAVDTEDELVHLVLCVRSVNCKIDNMH